MSVSPPRPKMPSLNTLRAFEAVARMTSISAAADELCVTSAAVAQHVKLLEAWAGEKLLKRNPQGVELTPLGASVLTDFKIAFDQLGVAVQKLRTNAAPFEVRIAALPSIAQLWLSPRLPEIRATMPEVAISVSALEQCPNLIRDSFDLAIFYQNHEVSDNSIIVGQDAIFPVSSPAVVKTLNSPSDLASEVFLHDMTWKDDWKVWLSKVLPNKNFNKSGPEFTLYSLAVEECKNGAGILMGHQDLVRSQIENGELVAVFDEKVHLPRNLVIKTQKPLPADSILDTIVAMLLKKD